MSKPKVHYAECDMTACCREVANYEVNEPMIQHTTVPEHVTCKLCLKIIGNKEKYELYLDEWVGGDY
jgi:hypothetical protein